MANFTLSTKTIAPQARRSKAYSRTGGLAFRFRIRRAARNVDDALSDEGPFHPLVAKEARRQVLFAYVFYGGLAVSLLAVLIWR
jgi:hypothetical protein